MGAFEDRQAKERKVLYAELAPLLRKHAALRCARPGAIPSPTATARANQIQNGEGDFWIVEDNWKFSTSAFNLVGAYAGKVLRGAKPTDLPDQQPTTFRLVVFDNAVTQW